MHAIAQPLYSAMIIQGYSDLAHKEKVRGQLLNLGNLMLFPYTYSMHVETTLFCDWKRISVFHVI